MLVISRKKEQKIFIGDDIVITVTQGSAKIGIDAPRGVKILREEVRSRAEGSRRVIGGHGKDLLKGEHDGD
jgi:carbon storage regulator